MCVYVYIYITRKINRINKNSLITNCLIYQGNNNNKLLLPRPYPVLLT